MKDKYRKHHWIWPETDDVESARKAAKQGMYASFIIAVFLFILLLVNTPELSLQNVDPYSVVDILIYILIGWRIGKMSKTAAVLGLIVYLISQVYIVAEMGFSYSFIKILFILMFVNAIRGTFTFRKLNVAENAAS